MIIHSAAVILFLALALPAKAVIDGNLDDAPWYPSVVVMLVGDTGYCSATKIADRRFLTAAHCVADTSTGALAKSFEPGQLIRVSNATTPSEMDFLDLRIERADLYPEFAKALDRFHAYKEQVINEYRERYQGADLEQRIRNTESYKQFTIHSPDVAVVTVREPTPGIPVAMIDFEPLIAEDKIHLVGYGCEKPGGLTSSKYGRRHWGESRVIRIDPINFYTFAHRMRPGSSSLCPGDSGGPVMRAGQVVGVNGVVHGLSPVFGARSNMSVNLHGYKSWSLLH